MLAPLLVHPGQGWKLAGDRDSVDLSQLSISDRAILVQRRGPLVRFLGTGTPLGVGGSHQACILVQTDSHRLLLDCGMTAMASLGRAGLDPADIDAIVISHLHGDHFGGLPLILLDATMRARSRPLIVAGPAATRQRAAQALEVFGWTTARVDVADFVELTPGASVSIVGCEIRAIPVTHNPATQATAVRLKIGETVIGYSGDAGWSPALEEAARGADLFICGVWSFDTPDETFLDLATLRRSRDRLECRRLILTHLGPTLLEHLSEVPFEVATDGSTIEL